MIFSKFINLSNKSALALVSAGLILPQTSFGARVANFSAAAQNIIQSNKVKDATESGCMITITNVSDTPQAVTFSIRLYAQTGAAPGNCWAPGTTNPTIVCAGTGTDYLHSTVTNASLGLPSPLILAAASPAAAVAANCSASSNTCTLPSTGVSMTFPVIQPAQPSALTQNVRCEGRITVDNYVAGTPGFIVANGTLTTLVEALAGVGLGGFYTDGSAMNTGKNNTTSPTFTPITIGEGRPF